jgi:hypothetical protein
LFRDLIGKKHNSVGGCSGLATIVCNRYGIPLPEDWVSGCLFEVVKKGQQRKGDIIHMMSMDGAPHVGAMISKLEMLHSTSKLGVCKLRIDHPAVYNRILGYYRYVPDPVIAEGKKYKTPQNVIDLLKIANDDDGGTLAYISLAVLAMVASYGVSAALAGTTYAASASFWGSAAAFATMTAGGMIINNALAPGDVDERAKESPTYGWSANNNTAAVGIAIPVINGNCATYPNVINQWIGIDEDGNQWSHNLLCIGEGLTNNLPTSTEIKIDGQYISTLGENYYTIETTDGGVSPAAALTNHGRLHQMRSVDKEMQDAVLSNVLLHFNGENDSTIIEDDAVGVVDDPAYAGDTERLNTWSCKNGAKLSTAHPFIPGSGQANLTLEAYHSYIQCDQPLAFVGFRHNFDFECRFRQDSLTNSIIAFQSVNYDGSTWYWNICYYDGDIVYQLYKDTSGVYTEYINIAEAVSLSIDTWHHIRIARNTEIDKYQNVLSSTVYIYLDGDVVGTPTELGAAFEDPGIVMIYADPTEAKQFIGTGYYYNGVDKDTLYGNCELDELRMTALVQLYDLGDTFEVPTNALSNDGEHTHVTMGEIDSFLLTIYFPAGLYKVFTSIGFDDTGTYYDRKVEFWVSYRKEGTSTWYRYYVSVIANQTRPLYKQWEFTPSAGRGKYEIRFSRLHYLGTSQDSYTDVSTCMFTHIDEILDESLRYPYLQLLSVSIKANSSYSNKIPAIQVINNRTEVVAPNYDGYGTRTIDITNNVNCAFDALTNRVYGVGMDPTSIIESGFEEGADWCDGLVDGNKRCQINMAFDESFNLDDALSQIEQCGRLQFMLRGTRLTAIVDKPSDTISNLYIPENTVPSTGKVTILRTVGKSDATEITFIDKDNEWVEDSVISKNDGFNQLTRPPSIVRLKIRGINNRDQAMREAIIRQQMSNATKRSCGFQSGLEAVRDMPGDVIKYGHGTLFFTGRLQRDDERRDEYSGTTVYLDREITLDSTLYSGDCFLNVRQPDDVVAQYTVTGPFDTATRSVVVSEAGEFNALSPWKILRNSGPVHQFRINTIQRSSRIDVSISALQYDETAYYNIAYGSGVTPI